MSPEDRLRVGMTVEDACLALPGWRFQQVYAPTDPSRFHTWDFIAPGADGVTLRLTFDARQLLLWGPPAPNGPALAPPAGDAAAPPDVARQDDLRSSSRAPHSTENG